MLAALSIALFVLSVLSGMLGIGVAFAAIPVLSLVLPAGALLGSRIASVRISPERLRAIFAATVLATSAYRIARFYF